MVECNNIVVISDTHCGDRLGLIHKDGIDLDDGGKYLPSSLQLKMWEMWREFWDEWVPIATRGEPYVIVHNGDAINGKPHGNKSNISDNVVDQRAIAVQCLLPERENPKCIEYYHIRGTEAHVGKSGEEEEALARDLGAKANESGMSARYDLWKTVGDDKLVHFLHHIGTTGSNAYEATAVHKELVESFIEAVRWDQARPDVIVRSHRHRCIEIAIPVGHSLSREHATGKAYAVVTPAWQGKTPFSWKIAGARLATPQFGGIVIRYSEDELFIRTKVWNVDRSVTE
jgi:hypothetical protein